MISQTNRTTAKRNGIRVKSRVRAGELTHNHNQTTKGLRVTSRVKVGDPNGLNINHHQAASGVRMTSRVKVGTLPRNHNQAAARRAQPRTSTHTSFAERLATRRLVGRWRAPASEHRRGIFGGPLLYAVA